MGEYSKELIMALSTESLSYLISGMGDNQAGADLITAIQNQTTLSASDFIRLESCFSENDIATNFQNCILGTYQLQLRDVQFVKDAFCLDLTALASVLANLAGGYNPNININYL
jgi:hypothetical protein